MGYPRRLGGYLPSNLNISGDIAVGDDVTVTDDLTVGDQLLLTEAAGNHVATPTIALGDGDSGWYESADDTVQHVIAGVAKMSLTASGATYVSATNLTNQGGYVNSGLVSPAQITSNQTDYAAGLGNVRFVRLSSDASRTIFSFSGGAAYQEWILVNVGAQNIVLAHDDGATGTAALRMLCPGSVNYTLGPNESVMMWYDSGSSRYRIMGYV